MISVLRHRNVRQGFPNSNLAFFRYFADDNNKDNKVETKVPKAASDQILHSDNEKNAHSNQDPKDVAKQIVSDYPEEPTTCCMSGCANCVWLDYAEKLSAYYRDGGERAIKEINEKVSDPNIKAFLLQELRSQKS